MTMQSEITSSTENSMSTANKNKSSTPAADLEAVESPAPMTLKERFRKFMPVVVDVETAGFNAQTDALLEIACIPILLNDEEYSI